MRTIVTQKPIGFKIDLDILAKLETYCNDNKKKKNAVINLAIKHYLDGA